MAISFIKLPRYKRFEYTPRYWDPEKEKREERIREIKREMGVEIPFDSNRTTTIRRGSFRQRQKQKAKASRASNIRLMVILAALFLIAYLIFFA